MSKVGPFAPGKVWEATKILVKILHLLIGETRSPFCFYPWLIVLNKYFIFSWQLIEVLAVIVTEGWASLSMYNHGLHVLKTWCPKWHYS